MADAHLEDKKAAAVKRYLDWQKDNLKPVDIYHLTENAELELILQICHFRNSILATAEKAPIWFVPVVTEQPIK